MQSLKLVISTLIVTALSLAGHASPAPNKDLDFWVGEWTVTDTTPNAKNPIGTNSIKRIYGGKVIQETFKMGTFEGQSWSVFNPQTKIWNQTWVDNSGGYIAMHSLKVNGNLAIQTLPNKAKPNSLNRMVFTNVKPDSFTWIWEATQDGGKTWKLSWRLQYKRTKSAERNVQVFVKAAAIQARFDSIL